MNIGPMNALVVPNGWNQARMPEMPSAQRTENGISSAWPLPLGSPSRNARSRSTKPSMLSGTDSPSASSHCVRANELYTTCPPRLKNPMLGMWYRWPSSAVCRRRAAVTSSSAFLMLGA